MNARAGKLVPGDHIPDNPIPPSSGATVASDPEAEFDGTLY